MTRRECLAMGAAAPLAVLRGEEQDSGQGPVRYPDPNIVSIEKAFDGYRITSAAIERVYTGCRWAEGPAWNGAGEYLMWSDIPNDRQMRRLNEDGHVSTLHHPSGYSNGNTFDFEGRQLSCEHQNRRVVRYDQTGEMTVIADKFEGKRFNAPNDIVVHPDGAVWFTDPGYGATSTYEGGRFPMELKEAVYRVDPKTGHIAKVTDELFKPNGLCFSPDYKQLYICDTGATHYPQAPKEIRVYDLENESRLKNGKRFITTEMADLGAGLPDGIRADKDGNIWCGCGWVGPKYDGVHVFSREGTRIGLILLPEVCANVCFGGPRRNRLFMAASQSIYSLYVEAIGAHIC